jgi:glycosyltransferase involved in cell wall biosynthesis
MTKTKFSIIMPLFNHELYVGDAINSVLNQKYSNFELIICNDGSTDNSYEIAKSFNDDRIKFINKPNAGTVSALNACILQSSGEYICWLSSDDYFEINKLDYHLYAHNNSNSLVSVAPSATFKNENFTNIDYKIKSGLSRMFSFFEKNPINGLAICAHRNMYLNYGLFNSRYKYSHDYERWLCFLKYEEPVYIDGAPQSFTRLGTSFVEDNNPFILGVLDNIKVLVRLMSGGLEYFIPNKFTINDDSLVYILKYFLILSHSSNNYLFRYGLSEIYIKSLCSFIIKFHATTVFNDLINSNFYDTSEDVRKIMNECKNRIETNDIKQDPFLFFNFLKSLSVAGGLSEKEKVGVSYYINDCFY